MIKVGLVCSVKADTILCFSQYTWNIVGKKVSDFIQSHLHKIGPQE